MESWGFGSDEAQLVTPVDASVGRLCGGSFVGRVSAWTFHVMVARATNFLHLSELNLLRNNQQRLDVLTAIRMFLHDEPIALPSGIELGRLGSCSVSAGDHSVK